MKKKNLAFTLAEVLIVIGIIGVVAALSLPNLNHATGDKETVTRLQKAYSILNEANDRAVAIYGPVSTWIDSIGSADRFYLSRIAQFMKISKMCNDSEDEGVTYIDCEPFRSKEEGCDDFLYYQLQDDITIYSCGISFRCSNSFQNIHDSCGDELYVDVNGPNKGKNKFGYDIFCFSISDSTGIIAKKDSDNIQDEISDCLSDNGHYYPEDCTFWPIEFGNLDYLKADSTGKCNDSSIILDGTTNTSCH